MLSRLDDLSAAIAQPAVRPHQHGRRKSTTDVDKDRDADMADDEDEDTPQLTKGPKDSARLWFDVRLLRCPMQSHTDRDISNAYGKLSRRCSG